MLELVCAQDTPLASPDSLCPSVGRVNPRFSSTPGDALREARNGLSEGPPETIYYMVETG